MAYENRTVQSGTANSLPSGTDPLVDNTASGDVQAIKILNPTAGSVAPMIGQQARADSMPVALSIEDAALLDGIEAALAVLGTQATLAAILAKLVAAPATEAKQDSVITLLTTQAGYLDGVEAALASILAKIIMSPSTEAKQDSQIAALGALLSQIVLAAGTNNIGDVDVASIAAGDNNIGNVDIASMPNVTLDAATLSALETINAAQSGIWTVQPGNTANTTPWLVKEERSGTATTSQVNDTASSTTLLASNADRLGATVHNDSTAILYLKLGTTASATDYTVAMAANAYYEVPYGYTGRIDGIWANDASGAARITELT